MRAELVFPRDTELAEAIMAKQRSRLVTLTSTLAPSAQTRPSHGADALRTFATGFGDNTTTSSDYRIRRPPPPRVGTHWSA
jgi:hypothetical protein